MKVNIEWKCKGEDEEKEFEDAFNEFMLQHKFELLGSGYNFETDMCDICYERIKRWIPKKEK